MFGELVTAYLFLAGVGAGGVAAASVADLLFVHEPFGADVVPDFAEKRPAERLVAGVLALSCGALALGAGCLVRERWRSRSGVGRDARAYPLGVPVSEPRAYPATVMALAAALVLVGAVGLRAAVVEAGAQRPLELQEAEASASVPSENEAAAGLLSTPSEKDGGQDGAAPEREDVTLWSN